MKEILRALGRMTRAERLGTIGLCALLAALALLRVAVGYLAGPPDLTPTERQWLALQAAQRTTVPPILPTPAGPPAAPVLFAFDPNTVDSAGCIRLGLSARLAHGLLQWRRRGKHFYKAAELARLYGLSPEQFHRLETWVRIASPPPRPDFPGRQPGSGWAGTAGGQTGRPGPGTGIVELNRADSGQLVRLPGIGPYRASRLLEHRRRWGGFLSLDQLRGQRLLPDSVLDRLAGRLRVDPGAVGLIRINREPEAALAARGCIGPRLAAAIVRMRSDGGPFRSVAELRGLPLMNEEIYRKIAPYITID